MTGSRATPLPPLATLPTMASMAPRRAMRMAKGTPRGAFCCSRRSAPERSEKWRKVDVPSMTTRAAHVGARLCLFLAEVAGALSLAVLVGAPATRSRGMAGTFSLLCPTEWTRRSSPSGWSLEWRRRSLAKAAALFPASG
ncbi:hypothetical protein I4F81_011375 [Pyropia yezoensis]|uniref:Uncharacterized protein n=1 Tax=Pyropia yezoensis TaxID=2788 RepID=A0ACC3CGD4_PYRYE|nr:hypothetical protein I4F81_011375 [Neopyropia yezoensis]